MIEVTAVCVDNGEPFLDFLKWLGGFFDGEGSVSLAVCVRDRYETVYLKPRLAINVSVPTESVLREIREKLGGCLYYREQIGLGTLRMIEWSVSSLPECLRVASSLLPYVKYKRGDLEHFKEICERMMRQEHFTKEGVEKIIKLGCNISASPRRDMERLASILQRLSNGEISPPRGSTRYKYTERNRRGVLEMHSSGLRTFQISKTVDIPRQTISNWVKKGKR